MPPRAGPTGEAPDLLKRVTPWVERLDDRLRARPLPPAPLPPLEAHSVSVVVQGPVGRPGDQQHRWTVAALASVRRVLPGAELVLSTWQGSDVSDLDADELVLSADPGPSLPRDPSHVVNNVNRQVVTTRRGLLKATRPHAWKLRTDMELVHGGALALFGGWPARAADARVLGERILVPTPYTFNPCRVYSRFPYMVSDWSQLGTREDLLEVWSAPRWDPVYEWLLGRRIVASEQWVWMSLLNRHDMDAFIGRRDVVEHSALCLVNNAVVLELDDLGLRMNKVSPHLGHRAALWTHGEWQAAYERVCCGARPRHRVDRQALLRTAIDRLWVNGLALPLIGPPADQTPSPRPVVPPLP